MTLLNTKRPPTFCPGCGHEKAVEALDKALLKLEWKAHEIVIVSDIGCSGLFDTFFNTHAFHGLHGRALTYAVGLKLARPQLHVIVTMGDGGIGIGAAHLLSTCRRNIDITLLVLNNFNFGMTGGQGSPTTPIDLRTGSGFLSALEKPIDISRISACAGAGYAVRASVYDPDLPDKIAGALRFEGFSVLDIQGICTGRLTAGNKLTPAMIAKTAQLSGNPSEIMPENIRPEYVTAYRKSASAQPPAPAPLRVLKRFKPIVSGRKEVLILGGAGQRIVTAGEILCLAGMTAGLQVTRKTDYPVTVLRGYSLCEVVLSTEKIVFTGIEAPTLIIALSQEGVDRKRNLLERISTNPVVIMAAGVSMPPSCKNILSFDFRFLGIKSRDWALASLGILSKNKDCISEKMLMAALSIRFKSDSLAAAEGVIKKAMRS